LGFVVGERFETMEEGRFYRWFLCRRSINWSVYEKFSDFETQMLRQLIQKRFF